MALEQTRRKDWYQILGAQPSDSPAELKQKYQRLALLYHPDKQKADVPAGEVEERVQRFIEIDQAWKILGNEETKKEYDLQQRVFWRSSVLTEIPLHLDELLYKPPRCSVVVFKRADKENNFYTRVFGNEDNLTKEWPLHAQIYLQDMSWIEDEQCYTLSCRCGGSYAVSKSESKDVSLVCCDTCSLVIEILQ